MSLTLKNVSGEELEQVCGGKPNGFVRFGEGMKLGITMGPTGVIFAGSSDPVVGAGAVTSEILIVGALVGVGILIGNAIGKKGALNNKS